MRSQTLPPGLWSGQQPLTSPQAVAATLGGHKEKVQTMAFHPMEAHSLLTGCCDAKVGGGMWRKGKKGEGGARVGGGRSE